MSIDQIAILVILGLSLLLFLWGRWRYDLVAILALLSSYLAGLIPADKMFKGFSHPAVITVAAVLILSRTIKNSGLLEHIGQKIKWTQHSESLQIFAFTFITAAFSAFMNNVGALALVMPLALQQAAATKRSPSIYMMPLAAASLLGGLITLIGTPPNIIISGYRESFSGEPFHLFDFAPVGILITVAGLIYIAVVGWRFIPLRRAAVSNPGSLSQIKDYIMEAQITNDSSILGKSLWEIEALVEADAVVIGIIRGARKIIAPAGIMEPKIGDVLVLEGKTEALQRLLDKAKLKLLGADGEEITKRLQSDDIAVMEAVIGSDSKMIGETARSLHLRTKFGINLLALSRQGSTMMERLARTRFQAGDVLLLQGEPDAVNEALIIMGCMPLAGRDLSFQQHRKFLPPIIFILSILATAFDIAPPEVSFLFAAVAMILTKSVSLRHAYEAIEWPILILIGAMIPVGEALETSGATKVLAEILTANSIDMPIYLTLSLLMIITMIITAIINNSACAVIMGPIAAGIAKIMGVNPDPFLMTVCIAASSDYLTPIGHQSNTVVMGPGGYKFSDYWKMGLLLQIITVVVGVPAILYFWPL